MRENMNFEILKEEYDREHSEIRDVKCFLPVHLTKGLEENRLVNSDGTWNEQYYKWQFLSCYVASGLCPADYIGTEVQFPKGNKGSAMLKIDAAVFDDKSWFYHYQQLHSKKDDSKWDELNWLKEHLLCVIEFKKDGNKDIKCVFNSQLKVYMNESSKSMVYGILYDEGRLYFLSRPGRHIIASATSLILKTEGKQRENRAFLWSAGCVCQFAEF